MGIFMMAFTGTSNRVSRDQMIFSIDQGTGKAVWLKKGEDLHLIPEDLNPLAVLCGIILRSGADEYFKQWLIKLSLWSFHTAWWMQWKIQGLQSTKPISRSSFPTAEGQGPWQSCTDGHEKRFWPNGIFDSGGWRMKRKVRLYVV